MDPSQFALAGIQEPSVDAERISSKPKADSGANANTIPLLCILCEKTPKFSDVSHLLTHISSKGHLSRRFHIDLQAQTDPNAKQLLERFDMWFKQNGIQQLLTTRQEAKDQKRRTHARKQRGVSNEVCLLRMAVLNFVWTWPLSVRVSNTDCEAPEISAFFLHSSGPQE